MRSVPHVHFQRRLPFPRIGVHFSDDDVDGLVGGGVNPEGEGRGCVRIVAEMRILEANLVAVNLDAGGVEAGAESNGGTSSAVEREVPEVLIYVDVACASGRGTTE
nr:hypothetical protein [uncultured archaeon]